jgi:hypothetical protein
MKLRVSAEGDEREVFRLYHHHHHHHHRRSPPHFLL